MTRIVQVFSLKVSQVGDSLQDAPAFAAVSEALGGTILIGTQAHQSVRYKKRRKIVTKLQGKVAVITGGNSGIGLATALRFVAEGAYVFITGRRQNELDAAVKQIGKNVTAVRGDVSNLADLDRLYDTVKQEKGNIDILFANAGTGEFGPLGTITDEH